MAPSVPPSLKKIKVFLSRAEELDRDKGNPESRVVAYNLRQYAVLTGIPLAGADPAAKACLGDLLNELEKEKAAMAVFSKAEHWKISRKVADRVFEKADAEDRAGAANKGTAKTFYAAGTFYEILQQFHEEGKEGGEGAAVEGEVDETQAQQNEEEQRRIYCKWKATDILNAVKEGRTPTPGGYEEPDEVAPPMEGPPEDVPTDMHGLPTVSEEELPPAPSMPSSDFFNAGGNSNETYQHSGPAGNVYADMPPPPANDGFELSINGEPTPTMVEDVDVDSDVEEIFIPGSANNANKNSVFDDAPTPDAPPPPYTDLAAARSYDTTPSVPPPAVSRPLPSPVAAAPSSSTNTGVFSSLFGGHSSSNKKLSKAQMADAVELTKFALSALQQGDGDLGRERLEQALGVWISSTSKKSSGSTFSLFGKSSPSAKSSKLSLKQISDAAELTKFALAALNQGDGNSGKEKLKQALGVCKTS